MNRLKTIIEQMPAEELKLLQKDLQTGNIERLINNRLLESDRGSICPVCNTGVNEKSDMVLFFGPRDFRKKAVFCAMDCLQYFLHRSSKNGISRNNKDL